MGKPKERGQYQPEQGPTAPAPATLPPEFPIVGIGASAGCLAAIEEFLATPPSGGPLGMALMLLQHLDPDTLNALERVRTSGKRRPILLTVTDGGGTA